MTIIAEHFLHSTFHGTRDNIEYKGTFGVYRGGDDGYFTMFEDENDYVGVRVPAHGMIATIEEAIQAFKDARFTKMNWPLNGE